MSTKWRRKPSSLVLISKKHRKRIIAKNLLEAIAILGAIFGQTKKKPHSVLAQASDQRSSGRGE